MGCIVFIHGMGHNPNREYWRQWANQLLPYLLEKGIKQDTLNFNGIYYYDLVPQPGDGWKKLISVFSHDVYADMKTVLWEHIVRGGDATDIMGRGPIDGFVNLVVDNFGDIFTYLMNDEVFHQVNNRFYETLEGISGPVTLVAYSLGTMISFCALQKRTDVAGKVQNFITIGSPIFWFRKWLVKRVNLNARPAVFHWANLAGKLDVACPHLVGYSTCQPDDHNECQVEKYNPIKGHLSYFSHAKLLESLAKIIQKHW